MQVPNIDDLVVWTEKTAGGKISANKEPKVVVEVESNTKLVIYDNKSLQKLKVGIK